MKQFTLAVLSFSIVLAAFLMIARADGQTAKFEASENQTLRLRVKALEFASASEHYQAAVGAFNAEIKAVEKENGWAETDVQFHPDTLTFTAIAKIPERPKPSMDKPNGPPPEPATGQTPTPAK